MGGHTLKRNAEGVPDFLSGREFSRQEIQEIQETVRVCRRLSLKELVQTICERLGRISGIFWWAGVGVAWAVCCLLPRRGRCASGTRGSDGRNEIASKD